MSLDLKYSAQIDRPVEAVCSAVSDLKRMSEWFSVKEIRRISGPLAVGTQFQIVTEVMGEDRVMDFTVTGYEPCRRFVYSSSGKYPVTITMTLNPLEAGTHLTFEFSIKVSRLVAPMVKKPLSKQTEADLNRLVTMLEAG